MRRRRLTREALEPRVDVEVAAAGEAAQREAAVLGERDGQRGRRADADEHRRPGDGRLLHELERQPPAHAQQPVAQREEPVEQRAPDDLVHRVVAPDVLARVHEGAGGVEQPGRVHAAGDLERGLAQAVGQRGEQLARDDRPGRDDRALHRDLLERPLPADPARRRRVEVPLARVAQQRPGDLDDVGREVLGEPDGARAVDEPLAVEEAERELLVVAGRAHRDGERRAVDADLERLLDRDAVLLALADDAGGQAGGLGVDHATRSIATESPFRGGAAPVSSSARASPGWEPPMLMLIDTPDPRYRPSEPDPERQPWHVRHRAIRVMLPILASIGCFVASSYVSPFMTFVLTIVALTLFFDGALALLPRGDGLWSNHQ